MLILIFVDLVLKLGNSLAAILELFLQIFVEGLGTFKLERNPVHFAELQFVLSLFRLELTS